MRRAAFGLLGVLVSVPATVQAQDTTWNRYTLEDLGGVFIRMEVGEACQAAGVTAADFEAGISLKLIDSDVGVLTREEMLAHPALPELRVTLHCASGSNGAGGAVAYSVELRVQQSAQMIRDTQITLPEAVTWFSSELGVTTPGSAVQAIQSTLDRQVEAFATAWAEINSEEAGGA